MTRSRQTPSGTAAFTLLEVMAVLLLTSIVIGVALNHYIDLNRASERALGMTRSLRRSVALLDRVARESIKRSAPA